MLLVEKATIKPFFDFDAMNQVYNLFFPNGCAFDQINIEGDKHTSMAENIEKELRGKIFSWKVSSKHSMITWKDAT